MEPTLGRFEMEKFTGKEDFGMWKYKLLGRRSITKERSKKAAQDLRVRNLLGTCLSDVILRKVMDSPTSRDMWLALEEEYQAKSLPNRIYLKQQFASFRMDENKNLEDNLDTFLKLIADLASLKITISDEDQAIQLLTSLPPAYEQLVHTLKYGTGKKLSVREVKIICIRKRSRA
ncbi:unnamed protein product [Microthlaspi erraticum]|uniref:Retrovirus-related Pol polyprotein from transposon TNT 1-94 n=1 Tax=Microthlaspi erraticum TaxID=1685480 RepID=A0A6D2L1V4_9BRAS|nr:unnamed protein product [Microthlaspi erraticum]